MVNGKDFREALKVIHNMELDDFSNIFNWKGEYAQEKFSMMQRNLVHFVGNLDDHNMELFFSYLNSKLPPNSVNLIKAL
jgi:hypothetical protein